MQSAKSYGVWLKLLAVVYAASLTPSCKTTSRGGGDSSEVLAWTPEGREGARKDFTEVIEKCVPVIAFGFKDKYTIVDTDMTTPARQKVIKEFVESLVAKDNPAAERSASLLAQIKADERKGKETLNAEAESKDLGKLSATQRETLKQFCLGEAPEYVLTKFAAETNVVAVVLGHKDDKQKLVDLRFINKP